LAGAVRAEEAEDLALFDLEGQVLDGHPPAILLAQPGGLDGRRRGGFRGRGDGLRADVAHARQYAMNLGVRQLAASFVSAEKAPPTHPGASAAAMFGPTDWPLQEMRTPGELAPPATKAV